MFLQNNGSGAAPARPGAEGRPQADGEEASTARTSWRSMWCSSTRTSTNPWARQASVNASACVGCPAVAVEPLGAGLRVALAGEEPAAGTEHPAGLGQAGVDVLPVVHGGDGPDDGGDGVVEGDRLRAGRPRSGRGSDRRTARWRRAASRGRGRRRWRWRRGAPLVGRPCPDRSRGRRRCPAVRRRSGRRPAGPGRRLGRP